MENLAEQFELSIQKLSITKTDRLLLAVSGGLDSVVLTHLSSLAGFDFAIAHVNFQLRGIESDRDEAFVRKLADKYQKPFLNITFDTHAYVEKEKSSIQVVARNLRYEWFKTFIGNNADQFKFLLTGHHLDDNIETMLMHFFRGTGIAGLKGMPERNGHVIRPLLKISRERLKQFAHAENLEWVEDSSNASADYTRNFFRNQLIPSAGTVFPELHHNLENNLNRFSEAYQLYQQSIEIHKRKLIKQDGAEIQIPILLLKKVVPLKTVLFEIVKEYQFSSLQTDEIIRLMDSTNGKFVASSSHRIIKNRRWLIIAPASDNSATHIVIESESVVTYPEGKLSIKTNSRETSEPVSVQHTGIEVLDADKIKFPLLLRKWKPGDYFYPLGMKKKKKLARFFIDQKLSRTAKEKVWVLVMDKQIICIVGHRIDNRFRTDGSTHKVLTVKVERTNS